MPIFNNNLSVDDLSLIDGGFETYTFDPSIGDNIRAFIGSVGGTLVHVSANYEYANGDFTYESPNGNDVVLKPNDIFRNSGRIAILSSLIAVFSFRSLKVPIVRLSFFIKNCSHVISYSSIKYDSEIFNSSVKTVLRIFFISSISSFSFFNSLTVIDLWDINHLMCRFCSNYLETNVKLNHYSQA